MTKAKRIAKLKIDLKNFLKRVQRDEVYTHDLIYVNNLLEIAFIDAYKNGKITYQKLESLLYRS